MAKILDFGIPSNEEVLMKIKVSYRRVRGGSWYGSESVSRVIFGYFEDPSFGYELSGFRIVRRHK